MKKTTPGRDKKSSALGRSLGVAGLSVASLPFVVAPAMAETAHLLQPQDDAEQHATSPESVHAMSLAASISAAGLALAASDDEAEEEAPDDGFDVGYGLYLHDAGVIGAQFDDEDDADV